jgi:NADH-quinone oxidoreductase subunit F
MAVSENINLQEIDKIVLGVGSTPECVIPILQALQTRYQYLPESALRRVCDITEITPAAIQGVATFYSQFRHQPVGKHIVQVCVGTACHVKGSGLVYDAFCRELHLTANQDTDSQRQFTLQKVACLGCCTLAPVVRIDQVTYGHLTPEAVHRVLDDFLATKHDSANRSAARHMQPDDHVGEIRIGLGSCCVAGGSAQVQKALEETLDETGIRARIRRVGCVGMCHQTPLMELIPSQGVQAFYAQVKPEDVRNIVLRHFRPPRLSRRIMSKANLFLENLITDSTVSAVMRHPLDVRDQPVQAFLGEQIHIATEGSGAMDPLDLAAYRRLGGFQALEKILNEQTPEQVIEQIRASGLRGRGGAGFITGAKWQLVRQASDPVKFVICNGDEGDPGAFMDRMLLESYPFRVIEGMTIAAFAVGAQEGYLYIRAEYPLAVERIRQALAICESEGLLGKTILGRPFSLRLRVMEGAGAFVCGEETALIASIEGKRGMPRVRPPFPANVGLYGKPTLVNNCETFSLVPWVVRHGHEQFAALGSEKSRGTKVFALAGKIRRGGLIEVPMGITIRRIVEDIGGGTTSGQPFKAVQIGGPSGGCVPASLADTPVDYEALVKVGAMMGSGGLVVLDESDCMVDIARYFLSFTQEQSCGKCTFCRIGTRRMLDILEKLCAGQGRAEDILKLAELAHMTASGSLCGLGRTAPNPVLSTLKYFRHEYEEHVQGRCPAKKCKALIRYTITDACIGCTRCRQRCPVDAIPFTPYQKHSIDETKCTRCDSCRVICPVQAVVIE